MWEIENLVKHVGMEAEQYHSLEGYSSTFVKKVCTHGIVQAMHEQRMPKSATTAMQRGTMFHDLILEGKRIQNPHHTYSLYDGIKRGKKWDEHVAEAKRCGKIPCNTKEFIDRHDDYSRQDEIIEAVHKDAKAALSKTTHREVSFTFDWVLGEEYKLPGKARLDAWNENTGQIDDLKTMSEPPTARNMQRAIDKFYYHVQAAYYSKVSEAACGNSEFNWIFITNFWPYDSGYVECNYDAYVSGVVQIYYALDQIKNYEEGEYVSAAPRRKIALGCSKFATLDFETI